MLCKIFGIDIQKTKEMEASKRPCGSHLKRPPTFPASSIKQLMLGEGIRAICSSIPFTILLQVHPKYDRNTPIYGPNLTNLTVFLSLQTITKLLPDPPNIPEITFSWLLAALPALHLTLVS